MPQRSLRYTMTVRHGPCSSIFKRPIRDKCQLGTSFAITVGPGDLQPFLVGIQYQNIDVSVQVPVLLAGFQSACSPSHIKSAFFACPEPAGCSLRCPAHFAAHLLLLSSPEAGDHAHAELSKTPASTARSIKCCFKASIHALLSIPSQQHWNSCSQPSFCVGQSHPTGGSHAS